MNRLTRLAPLTGVLFAVLGVAAFGSSHVPPGTSASGESVLAFEAAHGSSQQVSDLLWTFAFAVFLLFSGTLRSFLRRTLAVEGASAVVLAGAAVMTAGATVYFGFDYALAVDPSHLDPAAAQAINVLALTLVLPVSAGGLVFGIASGAAILGGAALPHWLGWVAIAIGLVTASPAALLGIVAWFAWSAIVGLLIWRRSPESAETVEDMT